MLASQNIFFSILMLFFFLFWKWPEMPKLWETDTLQCQGESDSATVRLYTGCWCKWCKFVQDLPVTTLTVTGSYTIVTIMQTTIWKRQHLGFHLECLVTWGGFSLGTGRLLSKWFRSSSSSEQFSLSEDQEDFELGDCPSDSAPSETTRFSVMSNDSGIERDLPPGAEQSSQGVPQDTQG